MGAGGAGAVDERDEARRPGPGQAGVDGTSASAAGVGTPILVPTNQQVKTMDCEGRAVSVQGNANRLTLRGRCGPVTVGGNENILEVGSTTRIDTSGNRNVVKYRELVDDKAPVVTSGGTGNRVSKVEPQYRSSQAGGRRRRPPPPDGPTPVLSLAGCAPVAQLDRASGFEPGGREFESLRAHQFS